MPRGRTTLERGASGAAFDVRDFARSAVGNHRDRLPLDGFSTEPLEPGTLRSLEYLRELERATMSYLRNVLVTPTHKDARVTAFLTTWAYEKFWIADAIEAVLAVHGIQPGARKQVKATPLRLLHEVLDRLRPIRDSLTMNAIGNDVVAVHLASGTVDEWLVQAAYLRLGELDDNAPLAALIDAIMTVKARHLVFFDQESRIRLDESSGARALTRKTLARMPLPIGADSLPTEETRFFFDRLFGENDALERAIDERVDTLPGLNGLGAIARARAAATAQPARFRVAHAIGRAASSIRHGVLG